MNKHLAYLRGVCEVVMVHLWRGRPGQRLSLIWMRLFVLRLRRIVLGLLLLRHEELLVLVAQDEARHEADDRDQRQDYDAGSSTCNAVNIITLVLPEYHQKHLLI